MPERNSEHAADSAHDGKGVRVVADVVSRLDHDMEPAGAQAHRERLDLGGLAFGLAGRVDAVVDDRIGDPTVGALSAPSRPNAAEPVGYAMADPTTR